MDPKKHAYFVSCAQRLYSPYRPLCNLENIPDRPLCITSRLKRKVVGLRPPRQEETGVVCACRKIVRCNSFHVPPSPDGPLFLQSCLL